MRLSVKAIPTSAQLKALSGSVHTEGTNLEASGGKNAECTGQLVLGIPPDGAPPFRAALSSRSAHGGGESHEIETTPWQVLVGGMRRCMLIALCSAHSVQMHMTCRTGAQDTCDVCQLEESVFIACRVLSKTARQRARCGARSEIALWSLFHRWRLVQRVHIWF